MKILYNIFVEFLIFGMKIATFFNEKAKKGVEGRSKSEAIIRRKFSETDRVIWMHAASLGEYEQGLPVLQQLKQKFPGRKVLVTFFSPSGYEIVVKKNHIADAVCYLPFDRKADVQRFCGNFQTEIFFTVKYDFWYNLLETLKENGAKVFVVSALFYERQIFFKPYGKWFVRKLNETVSFFFHQNSSSLKLSETVGLENGAVSGDTRFDRVKQNLMRDNSVDFIGEFKGNSKLVVFGSSWEAEENIAEILAENQQVKIILAPHDLKRIPEIQKKFPSAKLYSEFQNETNSFDFQTLIIDSVGLLSKIYNYAGIAVVGGGFHSKGLHNILEAAVFGVPVIFGDHYRKNPEADALILANGAKSFTDEKSAAEFIFELLKNPQQISEMGNAARQFVENQPDATEIIIGKIEEIMS
ncbi:3-deoxy-D-manno-octulosonic acid transferase [Cruoricaptor ignavus]|uniref:3-deoxy-D-manno-octulosonic acid transferase n=1 Tax=Cruoricaptor ignavus TaxID=1118202 RepID=UPI00370D6222